MKIWDASNFRRTLVGLSLVLAPLLFAVVEIAHSSHSTDAASTLARAARDRSLELAYIYFQIASSILFILAFFALLHVVRDRGVVAAHIAGILGVVGAGLTLSRAGLQLAIWEMASPRWRRRE